MVPPIRVLHVINQFCGRGGAEVSLREIILGSTGENIEHGVAVLSVRDNHLEPLTDAGVAVFVPEREAGRGSSYRSVVAAIRAFAPDLVHTSLYEADLIGRLAAARLRVPVVTSLVNTPYNRQARQAETAPAAKIVAVKVLDRALAHLATTAFHAISETTAVHAVDHLRIDRRTIRVVPRGRSLASLGVRSESRRRTVRAKLGWGEEPVIINVARQEPQKGQLLLIEAMTRVLDSYPSARLVLVGRRGRSSDALWARVEELGIGDSVDELGVRTDVPELLAAADAFAFSSLYEGLGGAVVEAAGAALPVAAFAVPAVGEVLGDQHPWLVPIGDSQALAGALGEILADESRASEVAERQRERFVAAYELSGCVDGMLKLYRDVAAATSLRGRGWLLPPKIHLSA
jgi:glycosyltransferase involved in cell wall biosynthesis